MKKKGKTFLSRAAAGLSSAAVALTFTLQTGLGALAAEETESMEMISYYNADVDNDGSISSIDASLIHSYVAGTCDQSALVVNEKATLAGDFNVDGEVNGADAACVYALLMNCVVGYPFDVDPYNVGNLRCSMEDASVYPEEQSGTISMRLVDTTGGNVPITVEGTINADELRSRGIEIAYARGTGDGSVIYNPDNSKFCAVLHPSSYDPDDNAGYYDINFYFTGVSENFEEIARLWILLSPICISMTFLATCMILA